MGSKYYSDWKGWLDLNNRWNGNSRLQTYKVLSFCFVLVLLLLPCVSAYAQEIIRDPTGRAGEEPKPLPKELVPLAPPIQVPAPAPPEEKVEPFLLPRVYVREIKITGNTVFSDDTLKEVIAPFLNRELTDTDLESLRLALTFFYINKGYINSGAIIPDQTMMDGVITIHIIEGQADNIRGRRE